MHRPFRMVGGIFNALYHRRFKCLVSVCEFLH
jgi:hypothetical protein